MKVNKKVIYIISGITGLFILVFGLYFGIYNHNIDDTALNGEKNVKVLVKDDYIFFDGEGSRQALIFYPGAKVQAEAYGQLMKRIAANGIDCYLVKMPLNFALFGINKADKIIEMQDYEEYFIGGHSLGGVCASMYLKDNNESISALVLLGAYSSEDISNLDVKVLSIYGTNDGVLNQKEYLNALSNYPSSFFEYVIEGANHAGFGTYGKQAKDNDATINDEEQRIITANYIASILYER